MNKKLIFIPALLLVLAGCGPKGPENTSGTDTNTGSSEPIQLNHGTKESPLSITEFLAEADKAINKEHGAFAPGRFYVEGINKGIAPYANNSSQGAYVYSTLHLFENEIGEGEGLPVFFARRAEGLTQDSIYTGDKLVVSGIAEYYDGRYTIYPDGADAPIVESLEVGQSELNIDLVGHATISGTSDKYANGSNPEFTITPEEGYVVRSVIYKGVGVDVADNKFSVLVDGDADIKILVVSELAAEEDLPAGDYKVVVTKENSGLPTDRAVSTGLNITYYLADETAEHIYKPLNLKYDPSGAFNTSQYNEFKINKNKNLLITAPNGVISTIVCDFYSSQSCDVYKGVEDAGENLVIGTVGEPNPENGSSCVRTFEINDLNCLINVPSSANYQQAFYSLEINVHVA